MAFKFEKLEIWQLSMQLCKKVYDLIGHFPESEKFNLSSQLRRAVTSIPLNIAEGSTSQTNPEQLRFLGYAHRSLMEVVSCLMLAQQQSFLKEDDYNELYVFTEKLSAKILAMKKAIRNRYDADSQVNESIENYGFN